MFILQRATCVIQLRLSCFLMDYDLLFRLYSQVSYTSHGTFSSEVSILSSAHYIGSHYRIGHIPKNNYIFSCPKTCNTKRKINIRIFMQRTSPDIPDVVSLLTTHVFVTSLMGNCSS